MKLPFTIEQFLQVFKDYNQSVFPFQIILYLLALTIIFLSIKKAANSDIIINSILTFFWLWMGIVYHLLNFTTINKAAYIFGSIFIVQALLFFYYGVIRRNLSYKFYPDGSGLAGSILITFALVIYPMLGYSFGHIYPASPTFGLPCPTTIFTFGIHLWRNGKIPLLVLIIPFLWSIIGFSASIQLGMSEDIGLLIASITALGFIGFQKRKLQPIRH